MNERITLVSIFNSNSLEKIEYYTNKIDGPICKVPFGKNVNNRFDVDTLNYHFTLLYWNITLEKQVLKVLANINFSKIKVLVNDVKILKTNSDSYELYFEIEKNKELELLQEKIYSLIPSEIYKIGRRYFHISIHADKDYEKIKQMKDNLIREFKPFEIEVDTFGLFEIYPAKLVKKY